MAGPRSPNGRGRRLKPAPVWVRVPSGARVFDCSTHCVRSARIAPGNAPTSSSLGDEKPCPLSPPQHGAWRDPDLIASLAKLPRRGSVRIALLDPKLVTNGMRHADARCRL